MDRKKPRLKIISGGKDHSKELASLSHLSPEAQAVLESFQKKYSESQYQIRRFELELAKMMKKGASPEEIHELHLKMDALLNRQKAWIRQLMTTVETYRNSPNSPTNSKKQSKK